MCQHGNLRRNCTQYPLDGDVMWCDVMWCDVMWCDVTLLLKPSVNIHITISTLAYTKGIEKQNQDEKMMFVSVNL